MKKVRLPPEAYNQPHIWHLTINAAEDTSPFSTPEVTDEAVKLLRASSDKFRVRVLVYCFMPDHVHMLVQNEPGDDLVKFVRHFKQTTGFAFKQRTRRQLWQTRFYDRAMRSDEEVNDVAAYILGNPVNARMVERAEDYPWAGSFEWDLASEQGQVDGGKASIRDVAGG